MDRTRKRHLLEGPSKCARCGTEMIGGYLKVPVDTVFINSWQSCKSSNLQAQICPVCGHVELQATCPQDLARHDISDEELEALADEE
jgi:hypothetical protein